MPRDRVQFQKGLGLIELCRRYGTEEQKGPFDFHAEFLVLTGSVSPGMRSSTNRRPTSKAAVAFASSSGMSSAMHIAMRSCQALRMSVMRWARSSGAS